MDIKIRSAQPEDGKQIGQLIYDTVHTINRRDYSEQQVGAWAPDPLTYSTWNESFAYVAELNGVIAGFGNLTPTGYLHRFYIHKDFQGKGIGTLLLKVLENKAQKLGLKEISTEASVTAKSFFQAQGWIVEKQQTKVLREVLFINYKMRKKIC